jgi:ribonuclease T2
MRILFVLLLSAASLFANMQLFPKQTCGLFNNLKHTQNRGNVHLSMNRSYEMIRHHKGQYLLKVEGATPPQRWVDDNCLSLRPLRGTPLYGKAKQPIPASTVSSASPVSSQNLLALSWQNAFCETHRYKRECKRGLGSLFKKSNFTLHGLWPQPRRKEYCGVPKRYVIADRHKQWQRLPEPKLSSHTKAALTGVMPGVSGKLHRHEWVKHGSCYGTDAERYFSDAIALTQAVRHSEAARFFQKNEGKRVTLEKVREAFDQAFGKGSGSRVELRCNRGLITEVWLHLGRGGSDLSKALQSGRKIHSRCRYGIIDKAGYGR